MKRMEYRYTVTGSGPFPVDMLRYDRAWPASEDDSGRVKGSHYNAYSGEFTIHLRGLNEPTLGRWKSFGWEVRDVESRPL